MIYALASLNVLLLAALAFGVREFFDFLEDERRKAREERDGLLSLIREQNARQDDRDRSFRAEIASLHQSRVEETANLLQRIQAPEQAVTSHVAETAPPDPLPVRLENDEEMFEAYQERLENLGALSG